MKYAFQVDNLFEMSERLKSFALELVSEGISASSAFNARLAASELITNAIIHGGTFAHFECDVLPDRLKITVSTKSCSDFPLNAPCPDILAESGRGIYIVRSVCIGEIERGDGILTVYISRGL